MVMASLLSAQALADEGKGKGKGKEDGEYVTVVQGKKEDKSPSVRTIKRAEIEASGAHTTAELLEAEPSINAVSGSRGERIFTMRGFSQRQVVVLVDGAPAYIPYDGQVDLNMVPTDLVERVTVIKGPGSLLYGPNGMGGAVNIVTRRPGAGPLATVTAEAGRSNYLRLGAHHALRLSDRVAYTVHGGYSRQDAFALSSDYKARPGEDGGLRENSDREAYNLGARLWVTPADGHDLEAGATFVDGERGLPGNTAYSAPRYQRFTTWRSLTATLAHAGEYLDALKIDELLYVSLFDNLLDAYDDATFTTQDSPMASHSWYHDQQVGGRVRARYRWRETPWGPTTARLWFSAQHDRHQRDEEDGTPNLKSDRTILTVAPEAEARFLEGLRLTVGLQVDVELPSGDEADTATGLGPLLALRGDFSPRLMIQISAARRTRFPTLRERYSTAGGYREPNPGLRPEAAWNFGLEGTWQAARWLKLQVAAFDAEVSDLIERTHLGGGKDRMENIGSARLLGAEVGLQMTPLPWLEMTGGYQILRARRTDGIGETDHLQYQPEQKATFRLRAAPTPWLELTTRLAVVGPQDFQHPETLAWGMLGAYLRWNARLSFKPAPWATAYVNLKNILDANYQTKYGYPDPGRQLFAGLKLTYGRGQRWGW